MNKNQGRRTTRSSKTSKPCIEEEQTIEVKLENEDEPIFCRICLRIPPAGSDIMQITTEQKTKLQDTMKLKLRKDPRLHICPNCSNLLDIIADFKASVLKANQILLTSEGPLSAGHEEWFQTSTVQLIAQCKTTVEIHRQLIETACDPPVTEDKPEILDEPEICPAPPPDDAEVVEIKVEPFKEPDAVSNADGESQNEEDADDDDEDRDFAPKVTSSSDEDYADEPKKKTKKDRKPRRRKENPKFQPQLCTLCGKRVCGEAAEAHRNQHLGIKPYRCSTPGCNLEFYGPYHKTRHERRMHGESGVLTHKCHICGKMIRGPNGAFKYHLSLHGTSEKKFVCTICGKGFTLQRYLRQHGMTHSEEFPYACSYCGKRFNNKWSMRTHEKNMHEKRNHPSVPEAERTGKELEPTTETTWTSTENMELMNLGGE
uniref:Putative c2h2-type zn-finger protein n=1 Tax=Culex tarsalis TaxID=7177 RepID=A0A1Q3EZ42_CULTA